MLFRLIIRVLYWADRELTRVQNTAIQEVTQLDSDIESLKMRQSKVLEDFTTAKAMQQGLSAILK